MKGNLSITEPHAPHPDPVTRNRLVTIAANLRSPTEYALVRSSSLARETFTLLDLRLQSSRHVNATFSAVQPAYSHLESRRPGTHALFPEMVQRLNQMYAKETARTRERQRPSQSAASA